MSRELVDLLQRASAEIRELRQQRALLQAKVDGFELAGAFLFAEVRHKSQGMSVDVAWELERAALAEGSGLGTVAGVME
jgi:hypothetical protein